MLSGVPEGGYSRVTDGYNTPAIRIIKTPSPARRPSARF